MLESLPRCHHDGGSGFCKHLPTINNVLTVTFFVELVVRISCFPSIRECVFDGYTWVDIIALLPDLLELVRPTPPSVLPQLNTQSVQEYIICQTYEAAYTAVRLSSLMG